MELSTRGLICFALLGWLNFGCSDESTGTMASPTADADLHDAMSPAMDAQPPEPTADASGPMSNEDAQLLDAVVDGATPTEDMGSVLNETGCSDDLAAAFTPFADQVDIRCADGMLHMDSADGFPRLDPPNHDERMMVSITSWILRVPVPARF